MCSFLHFWALSKIMINILWPTSDAPVAGSYELSLFAHWLNWTDSPILRLLHIVSPSNAMNDKHSTPNKIETKFGKQELVWNKLVIYDSNKYILWQFLTCLQSSLY